MLVITYAFFQQKCIVMNEVVTLLLQQEINRDFEKLNEGKVLTRKSKEFLMKNSSSIQDVLQIWPRGSRNPIVQGFRNPMQEVEGITSGTKTISRPQSQGLMPRWRESRELMPLPPSREIIRFSFSLPSSYLFLDRNFTWLRVCPAVITCIIRCTVGFCKKRLIDGPERRGSTEGHPHRRWGPMGSSGARWGLVGPGEARRRSENAFAERLVGGMSIETTGTRQFTFLRPFATRLPSRVRL